LNWITAERQKERLPLCLAQDFKDFIGSGKRIPHLPVYPICTTLISEHGGYPMSKTSMVRARIQPKLKAQAEKVFRRLGLNATQAITLFYKQVELREGLPFEVAIPTSATKRTLESTDAGRDLIVCENLDEMLEKLGI
jgi:DNA-damage-inducible protein J